MKKMFTSLLTAAAMIAAPTAATAATAVPADVRAAATLDESQELEGRASTFAIVAGLIILVAIIALAVADNDEPVSP